METVSTYWIFKWIFHGIFASKCLSNGLIPTTNPHRISNRKFDISHSRVISDLRREVDENCTLLRNYAASITEFSGQPPILKEESLKIGPIGCPESSARNHNYSMRNNAEECIRHFPSS